MADTETASGSAVRKTTHNTCTAQFLTFMLGKEEFGFEILKVREIVGYMEVNSVPQTPPHVKGVVNLRGQVIPVIDLRLKFGMDEVEVTEHTCIIVVEARQQNQEMLTGIMVDSVREVLDILESEIDDAPHFDSSINTDFIQGIGKVGDQIKILLNIDKVLEGENLSGLC